MSAAVLVVNPAAAHGRTASRWPAVAAEAEALGLDLEVRLTDGPGDAARLARAAADDGAGLVIALGGDGTVSEIANGLVGADGTARAELAVVPSGTGGDFGRTFGIPTDPRRALAVARAGAVRRIDAGRVRFAGRDGTPGERVFVNVASAGFTGAVADRVNRSGKPLGGTVAFGWATLATFLGYRNGPVRVVIDGDERRLVANNVIVANCRYFGGGMRIAPQAEPDDGRFDVLVWGDVSRADLALNLHKLYRGTHLDHPKLLVRHARRVTVEPEVPQPIEADGEQPGLTPATFEVLPGAIGLRVPA